MTHTLDWLGFHVDDGDRRYLKFAWTGSGSAEFPIACCAEASVRPGSTDGSCLLVFRFKSQQSDATDLIVLRVGVPADRVQDAKWFVRWLHHEHGVPDRPVDEDEAASLERVPAGADGWLVAPTGQASEELFLEIMDRVESDTD